MDNHTGEKEEKEKMGRILLNKRFSEDFDIFLDFSFSCQSSFGLTFVKVDRISHCLPEDNPFNGSVTGQMQLLITYVKPC